MRKIITIAALALLVGCGQERSYAEESQPERVAVSQPNEWPAQYLTVVRDPARAVTCFIYSASGALSCIPDSQLQGR